MNIRLNEKRSRKSRPRITFILVAIFILGLALPFAPPVQGFQAQEQLHQKIRDGKKVFLNPSDPEAARTIDAQWILEAAASGVKIEIYFAVITGPFDAEDKTFDKGLILEGCVFTEGATLRHAVFKHTFDVGQAVFKAGATFQGATFEGGADFEGTRFTGGNVIFDEARFTEIFDATRVQFLADDRSAVSFINTRFEGRASFGFSQFKPTTFFEATQFSGDTSFAGSKFGSLLDFEHSHFLGPADFGNDPFNKKLSTTFQGTVSFSDTLFDSTATFDGDTFDRDVNFFNARFGSVARFLGTTFESNAGFSNVRFGGDGWFMGAKFLGQANFVAAFVAGSLFFQAEKPLPAAFFRKDAIFSRARVENFVVFGGGGKQVAGAIFAAKANFSGAKFGEACNFQGVEFKGDADFLDTTMENDAYFPGATFEGDALFDRVQIMGATLFSPKPGEATSDFARSARFIGKASFVGAHFGSGARFSGVGFDNVADFGGAHFDGDAHFEDSVFFGPATFRSTNFHAVYFSSKKSGGTHQFINNVDLLECSYDRIQVDWRSLLQYPNGKSRIQPYDRQPYIELENALRRSGSDEDADAVYEERRHVENRSLTGIRKLRDRLYWFVANYGIDLTHEFYLTLLFLGIGSWFFSRPGAVIKSWDDSETKIPWHEALHLAIHQFLPFGLPVKFSWSPSRRIIFKYAWPFQRASAYANFLQIIGWILIPLAAAALTGILRHGAQ